jgi:hypothetical protein
MDHPRTTYEDEARTRDDFFEMGVLPIPSLELVAGGLADLHSSIESERLDNERCRFTRHAKSLFPPSFHASDEAEETRAA